MGWFISLTWHPVEDSFSGSVIGLQESTVHRPVQMSYEAGGFVAFSNFLISLGHGVDIHKPIIRAHGQIRAIGWELQLMNDLLSVLDVDHLRHVSMKTREAVNGDHVRMRRWTLIWFWICLPDTKNCKRSVLHPESELRAVVVEGHAAHGLLHVTASDQCVFRQTPESEKDEDNNRETLNFDERYLRQSFFSRMNVDIKWNGGVD